MIGKIMKIPAIVLAALLLAVPGLGQPSVSGVVGDVEEGASIVISGSDFGTKTPAAPIFWDPVSGWSAYAELTNGDIVPTAYGGACPDCPYPSRSESYPVYYQSTGSPLRIADRPVYMVPKKGYFRYSDLNISGEAPVLYVSWWVMTTRNLLNQGSGGVFNKLLRVWVENSGTTGRTSWESNLVMHWSLAPDPGHIEEYNRFSYIFEDNQWSNLEATIFSEGITSTGGGRLTFVADGQEVVSSASTVASSNGPYDLVGLLGSDPHDPSRYDSDTYIYWGDVYIDDTLSKVVIGNAQDYASCTHREIQIPTDWSTTSIEATVNAGSFADESSAYLFVIDSDGVASAGLAVTIGSSGGGDPGPPGAPTGLRATEND